MELDRIICGESLAEVRRLERNSFHLILSDIPYGIAAENWDVLHDNKNSALLGASPAQQKSPLFKKRGKPLNGWSEADKKIPLEYYQWCLSWAPDWLRVLKPGASCFIFAGRRLAHRCVCALEDSGFIFKDMLAWRKEAAAHRAQNVKVVFEKRGDLVNAEKWQGWKVGNLRPLFEPILWFMKPYPVGGTLTDNIAENELGAYNEDFCKNNSPYNSGLEICSNIIRSAAGPGDRGLHPSQKPVALLEYLIGISTRENQIVLDPFSGSGSTLLAARNMKRRYLGIEIQKEYCEASARRLGLPNGQPG